MPQAVEQHSTNLRRRPRSRVRVGLSRRRSSSVPAALRARLERLIEEAIEALNALDAQHADLEPDHDGEAEPGEVSAQPVTLAPDRRLVVHRPSARQQRAAYRRNGDPIPSNLRRGLFGRIGA